MGAVVIQCRNTDVWPRQKVFLKSPALHVSEFQLMSYNLNEINGHY